MPRVREIRPAFAAGISRYPMYQALQVIALREATWKTPPHQFCMYLCRNFLQYSLPQPKGEVVNGADGQHPCRSQHLLRKIW